MSMSNNPSGVASTTDPWGVAQSNKYSVDNFYTGTSGNNTTTNIGAVRLPSSLYAEMAALIQSGVVPEYRHMQEIIRDAVIHRMKYLGEQRKQGNLVREVTVHMRLDAIDKLKKRREACEAIVRTSRDEFTIASGEENLHGIVDSLREAIDSLEILAQPYRGQMEEMILKYEERRKQLKAQWDAADPERYDREFDMGWQQGHNGDDDEAGVGD